MIVLDTNLLYGRAEPDAASAVKTVLTLARQVSEPVGITEASLVELLQGMRESLAEAQATLDEAVAGFKRLRVDLEVPTPTLEEHLTSYDSRLQAFIRRHDIEVLPFPDQAPDLAALFKAAASKMPPFDSTGNNYRDAIIALSVISYAGAHAGSVVFTTNDKRFKEAFLGSSVTCSTAEEVSARLNEKLSAGERARREMIRRAILDALNSSLVDLSDRISNLAAFYIPAETGEALQSIDRFDVTGVERVEPVDISGKEVEFIATLVGELTYTVEVDLLHAAARARAMINALRRPMRVGDVFVRTQPQERTQALYPPPGSANRTQQNTTPQTVLLTGIATIKDEAVVQLQYSGVKPVRRGQ